jgi:hypothetical protein
MRWGVLVIAGLLLCQVAHASDDGRYTRLHAGLNPYMLAPYRMGQANEPQGGDVQVMMSLHDTRLANEYGRNVEEMSQNPDLFLGRLGSLAMLSLVGAPAVENIGVMMFSTSDQLPVVAGLNVLYDNVNREPIAPVEGTIAFDGHIHTGRSHDGGDSYEAALLAAHARGLNAVAFTEHNEFDFARANDVLKRLKREGRMPEDFLLVPGEEVTSSDGHILAYFINHRVQPGMSAMETIRAIHAQGGIAVAPHPSGSGGVGFHTALALPFDGVEVMSGANIMPRSMLQDLESPKLGVGDRFQMANSDAHAASGIGVMYTRIRVERRTLDALKSAMRTRRTEAKIENPTYHTYYKTVGSPVGRVFYWPVLTYLDFKGKLLNKIASLMLLDKINVMTSWEHVALRMADLIFIPAESVRLARGDSDLMRPIQMRTASATKGPIRVSYEQYDLLGYSRVEPMWKLEAKVDF